MSPEYLYKRKPNITFTEIDNEIVLVHPEEGKYYSFNKVGSVIWKLLENAVNIEQLKEKLMAQFNVSDEQCLQEVTAFLKQLSEKGLIDVYKSA